MINGLRNKVNFLNQIIKFLSETINFLIKINFFKKLTSFIIKINKLIIDYFLSFFSFFINKITYNYKTIFKINKKTKNLELFFIIAKTFFFLYFFIFSILLHIYLIKTILFKVFLLTNKIIFFFRLLFSDRESPLRGLWNKINNPNPNSNKSNFYEEKEPLKKVKYNSLGIKISDDADKEQNNLYFLDKSAKIHNFINKNNQSIKYAENVTVDLFKSIKKDKSTNKYKIDNPLWNAGETITSTAVKDIKDYKNNTKLTDSMLKNIVEKKSPFKTKEDGSLTRKTYLEPDKNRYNDNNNEKNQKLYSGQFFNSFFKR